MDFGGRSLNIVSNRLPVVVSRNDLGEWESRPSPGGLVAALGPILGRARGKWIGWTGSRDRDSAEALLNLQSRKQNFDLIPVPMSEEEIDGYYCGFSNKTIWPLFHDLLGEFSFNIDNWYAYQRINRRFAEIIVSSSDLDSIIWIHDYQLLLVGQYLRHLGVKQKLDFFLHIPFPSYDLFRRLPRNRDILQAMLAYDHIGFQTPMDRRNFIACVKWFIPEAARFNHRRRTIIRYEGRHIVVGYYPISIDFTGFTRRARSEEVGDAARYLRENLKVDTIALGLDRLDYTKGIPNRMLAFERLLEKYPRTIGKISLLQVVVPSRLNVTEYRDLKSELDGLAGRINARFSQRGWTPIHYQYRSLDLVQLMGHYRAADIALVTPLRDGMNLVAKEYCAGCVDNRGILILSEFAGAGQQLRKGALMVNPYDIEGTADAIHTAINMPADLRIRRMKVLRSEVRRNDISRWINWFFECSHKLKKIQATRSQTITI